MAKVYIQAWPGPWGWRNPFYEWFKKQPEQSFELVDDIAEAEIVFQGDLNGWRNLARLSPSVRVVANVLDFGEWVNAGNLDMQTVEYVKTLKGRFNDIHFTGISPKVLEQLDEHFGIKAQAFYYPSQVTSELIKASRPAAMRKRKQFISFARLGDPGKAIPEAITAFEQSGLADQGWRYLLVGPERPNCVTPPGVMEAGFMETGSLYMMVAQSTYVLMPSRGEGLGLPIIEGLLVGTPFITRDIEPMSGVFSKLWNECETFKDDADLKDALIRAADNSTSPQYVDLVNRGFGRVHPWIREVAFSSLATYIQQEIING